MPVLQKRQILMCQPHSIFGFQNTNNGGMAEYVRYPKTSVISRVPEDMPLDQALLIEPYGCSITP